MPRPSTRIVFPSFLLTAVFTSADDLAPSPSAFTGPGAAMTSRPTTAAIRAGARDTLTTPPQWPRARDTASWRSVQERAKNARPGSDPHVAGLTPILRRAIERGRW